MIDPTSDLDALGNLSLATTEREPDNNEFDDVVRQMRRQQIETLNRSRYFGVKKNPDQYAKTVDLARRQNLPVDLVERNQQEIETRDKLSAIDTNSLLKDNPETARLLMDPVNMGMVQDDIPNLTKLENWFSRNLEGLGESAMVSVDIGLKGLELQIADLVHNRNLRNRAAQGATLSFDERSLLGAAQMMQYARLDAITEQQDRIAELTPANLSTLEEGFRAGLLSLMQQTPGMVATILTRNPQFMLGSMSAMTYGRSYAEARNEGLEPGQASQYAAIDAGLEYATELIPAGALVDSMKKGWRKSLTRFAAGELVGEYVAELGQTMNAIRMGLDEEWENAETTEQKQELALRRAAVVTIATIVGGGAQAAIFTGAGKVARMVEGEQAQQQTDQERLDALHQLAGSLKTKDRAPDLLKQHLAQLEETYSPDQKIFVAAEDVQAIIDEAENVPDSPVFQKLQEDLSVALTAEEDIAIPIADYTAEIAASDLGPLFREVVRLSPNTVSRKEAETLDPEDPLGVAELVERANAQAESDLGVDSIVEDLVDQQLRTGKVDPRRARVQARLVAAYFKTAAAKRGMDPKEMFEAAGLQIRGEDVSLVPEAIYEPGQDLSGITIEDNPIIEETGEKVTIRRKAQDLWDNWQTERDQFADLGKCLYG